MDFKPPSRFVASVTDDTGVNMPGFEGKQGRCFRDYPDIFLLIDKPPPSDSPDY